MNRDNEINDWNKYFIIYLTGKQYEIDPDNQVHLNTTGTKKGQFYTGTLTVTNATVPVRLGVSLCQLVLPVAIPNQPLDDAIQNAILASVAK